MILRHSKQGKSYNFYKYLNNTDWAILSNSGSPKVRLQDGTSLIATFETGNCNNIFGTTQALQSVCGEYDIDINGDKGPNKVGRDYFRFLLTNYGIIPAGSLADTSYKFNTDCITGAASGYSCTAWAIYNENMEYLRCSTLSWGGATTCN